MQTVQNTPSVCFQFEDGRNTDFSQILFEFSCTNQKKSAQVEDGLTLTPVDLTNMLSQQNRFKLQQQQTIQTEQFFEEFESNFVVTFDDSKKTKRMEDPQSCDNKNEEWRDNFKPVHFQKDQTMNIQQEQQRISLPILNKRKSSLLSIVEMKSEIINKTFKENRFLPVMQIKKRSIFKNKENLITNMQSFKGSSNKIVYPDPLKIFPSGSFTCRHANQQHKQYFTSKVTPKDSETAKILYKKYQKATIFCENRSDIIPANKKSDYIKQIKNEQCKRQSQKTKKSRQPKNINIFKKYPLVQ